MAKPVVARLFVAGFPKGFQLFSGVVNSAPEPSPELATGAANKEEYSSPLLSSF